METADYQIAQGARKQMDGQPLKVAFIIFNALLIVFYLSIVAPSVGFDFKFGLRFDITTWLWHPLAGALMVVEAFWAMFVIADRRNTPGALAASMMGTLLWCIHAGGYEQGFNPFDLSFGWIGAYAMYYAIKVWRVS